MREPEGNGCAERFIRTLKGNLLRVRPFATVEEFRLALRAFAELQQGLSQFLDGAEGLHPQEVLLQRADEPLGAAVPFGGTDEGR